MKTRLFGLLLLLALVLLTMGMQAPEDFTDLPMLLAWLVTAPGAGAVGYGLIRVWPEKWWPKFGTMTQMAVRNYAFLVSGGVGITVQILRYQIGYATVPMIPIERWEALFNIFMSASGFSTFLHGLFELRGKVRDSQ